MKSKRILTLILCLLLLCGMLSSCRAQQTSYTPPTLSSYDNKFNYNNLSAGADNIFIDGQGMYYNDKEFFQRYCRVYAHTEDGVTPVFMAWGDVQSVPQKYGNKMYVLYHMFYDMENSYLIEYDYSTQKRKTVATIPVYWIDNIYVVDDVAYYTTSFGGNSLNAVHLDTGEILPIEDSINACGVVDGRLRYVICEDFYCTVYEYDAASDQSAVIGGFDYTDYEFIDRCIWANFTKDTVIFLSGNYTIPPLFYWMDRNEIQQLQTDQLLASVVACEEYLFFVVDERDYSEEQAYSHHTVYRLCIETLEVEKIERFYGSVYLYVMSDTDVFIEHDYGKRIVHYNVADGTSEEIWVDHSPIV